LRDLAKTRDNGKPLRKADSRPSFPKIDRRLQLELTEEFNTWIIE
jgi:hypothetical protein